jgi:predicted metalloprotease
MPTASASARRPQRRRASSAGARPGGAGIRWDRVGRAAMLCVLCVLVYLYVSAGVRMFQTWRQSGRDRQAVSALEHEHETLVQAHSNLGSTSTLEAEARRLGMMKSGEQPYVVTGLPDN